MMKDYPKHFFIESLLLVRPYSYLKYQRVFQKYFKSDMN